MELSQQYDYLTYHKQSYTPKTCKIARKNIIINNKKQNCKMKSNIYFICLLNILTIQIFASISCSLRKYQ